MGSGKGLAILALIIGASGLGLGVYSFIAPLIGLTNPSGPVVVGLWESLDEDTDNPGFPTANDWLIEVGDEKLINDNYISLNKSSQHSNTRFHLIRNGWYKVNLHTMLTSTSSGAGFYQMYLIKNGSLYLILLYEASINQNLQVSREFFIDSDGNDYFEINCYHSSDSFFLEDQQVFNQLTIEYTGII
jgi:hypothetical protein